ncbi:MAG: energy transducer TonB [Pseudoxanthomonas sp.]
MPIRPSSRFAVPAGLAAALLLAACGQQPPADTAPAVPPTQLTAVHTPPPQYPIEAQCHGNGGTTTLRVTISADGAPSSVELAQSSGNDALDKAASEAVGKWEFKAATRGGQPVATTINVPVTFPPPQVKPDICFSLDSQQKPGG